jgi:hypothetical protein
MCLKAAVNALVLEEIQAKPSSGCNNEVAIFRTVNGAFAFAFALHAP